MISIVALWLPILVSAALVFVVSSVIHMLLGYHRNDFHRVPSEDAVLEGLRRADLTPGDYAIPYAGTMEAMKSEEYRQKVERGPVAFMTVIDKNRVFNMTSPLAQWFLYSVLVGILAAYLAGRTFGPGAEYLDVFRVTGTVAFAGYAMALMQRSIWFAQRWSVTLKSMFDGLVYALVTAGTFGWLWPAA
jgi:hypothetical protein